MPYYSRTFRLPFEEVQEKILANLDDVGFEVSTTIDIRKSLEEKLHVSFRNYKILGVFIPSFAYQAITLESHVGIKLPCNIVLQEHENGEVEVSAANPAENIDVSHQTEHLLDLALDVGEKLLKVIDGICHERLNTVSPSLLDAKTIQEAYTQVQG